VKARWRASTKRPSQEGSLPNPIIGGKFKNVSFREITLGEDPRTDIQAFFYSRNSLSGETLASRKSNPRAGKS